ncbi:hypothetical protein ABZZ20_20270 [Streptomyces sp. NPDC006430]|uniref:hypothetical protein n=1 Tax=Streptomyces sp. NPDC006430 TaxID=3154299 RepID=UPI0033BB4F3A
MTTHSHDTDDTDGPADPAAANTPTPACDEGGESACLLHRVCPECGGLATEPGARTCWRCGGPLPDTSA